MIVVATHKRIVVAQLEKVEKDLQRRSWFWHYQIVLELFWTFTSKQNFDTRCFNYSLAVVIHSEDCPKSSQNIIH